MWAPALAAWLGDEARPFPCPPHHYPTTVGATWAAMALEARCFRASSPSLPASTTTSSSSASRRARRRYHRAAGGSGGGGRGGENAGLSKLSAALLARTRLHGLRHVLWPRGGSLGRRAFWLLALCTSVGLLLSWSSNRLLLWLSFPTYTRVHSEWARELPFPTVTVCNNNPVRLLKLTKSDLYFAGHWLGLLLANRTARPLVLDLLAEERRAWFSKLSDFRLFLPPRHFEGTNLEFMDRLSHQLEDMLLSCKYRGEPCGAHNFTTVSPAFIPLAHTHTHLLSSLRVCLAIGTLIWLLCTLLHHSLCPTLSSYSTLTLSLALPLSLSANSDAL